MNHVSLLIKPASSLCNLRCRYCFYEDEAQHREQKCSGIMSEETAERLIDSAFLAHNGRGSISFSFQGGEPMLAGLPFFQRFVELVRQKNRRHVPIIYAIQTNGTLIDSQWARFLKENQFLVGLSVDGNKALHDENRIDSNGKGTYTRTAAALRNLQNAQVDYNLLCVVTKGVAEHPQRVYQEMKKIGGRFLQFIPCLDPLGVQRGSMRYSLSPEAYGKFLCGLFDCWLFDWEHGQYTSIRQFDDYVHLAIGMPPASCACAGQCGGYLVIEGDGSAYPCDFYALDEWKLGSICETSIEALMRSERYQAFIEESRTRPSDCQDCPYIALCRGGCRRDWLYDGAKNCNYYCEAYKQFFGYALKRIQRIALREQMAQMAR